MLPLCMRCHRYIGTAIWTVDDKPMVLCSVCVMNYYPTTNKNLKLIFAPAIPEGPQYCEGPLKPTGKFTKVNNTVFFEMVCTKCSFSTDIHTSRAQYAISYYKHELVATNPEHHQEAIQLDEGEASSNLRAEALGDEG